MDETTFRRLLRDVADSQRGPSPELPAAVLRRGRRRLIRIAAVAVLAASVLAGGVVAGVEAVQGVDRPIPDNIPTPHGPRSLPGTIAFAGRSSREGPPQVFLAHPDGTITQITHGPEASVAVAWSPDGSDLLMYGQSGTFVARSDGTPVAFLTHRVNREYGPAHWSPDGTKIAFQAGQTLYVVNADGTEKRTLASDVFTKMLPEHLDFSWSPDGTRIAYSGAPNGDPPAIYVVNVDGSGLVRLTDPSVMPAGHPAWSPDGSTIAFAAAWATPGCKNADGCVYLMRPDGTGLRRLRPGQSPIWSPDGSKIAFLDADGQVVVMDADRTNPTPIPGSSWYGMSWSPDGTKLVYISLSIRGAGGDVEIVNADGSGLILVTRNQGAAQSFLPLWRPSGG